MPTGCTASTAPARSPPRVDAPKPKPWPEGLPRAVTLTSGGVTLPRALKKAVYRDHRMYREQSEPLCAGRLEAQRRLDESHWRSVALEERALEPEPWAWWERVLVLSGVGAGGVILGAIIGWATSDRIVLQR